MSEHQPTANPEYIKAMREIRRSNAAGAHGDRRTKRNRDRSAKNRNAIKEQKDAE
jgi:hypothetical protein